MFTGITGCMFRWICTSASSGVQHFAPTAVCACGAPELVDLVDQNNGVGALRDLQTLDQLPACWGAVIQGKDSSSLWAGGREAEQAVAVPYSFQGLENRVLENRVGKDRLWKKRAWKNKAWKRE